jgi:hypothetical protein
MIATHAFWAESAAGIQYKGPDTSVLVKRYKSNRLRNAALAASVGFVTLFLLQIAVKPKHGADVVILAGLQPGTLYAPPVDTVIAALPSPPPEPPPAPLAKIVTPPAKSLPVAAPSVKAKPPVTIAFRAPETPLPVKKIAAVEPRKIAAPAPAVAKFVAMPKPEVAVVAPAQTASPKVPSLPKQAALPTKDSAATASAQADTRSAAERDFARASKPVDIAPGEKLGIRDVKPEVITLVNGQKVLIGGRLPNGEVLLSIDHKQGLVETTQRIMIVSP